MGRRRVQGPPGPRAVVQGGEVRVGVRARPERLQQGAPGAGVQLRAGQRHATESPAAHRPPPEGGEGYRGAQQRPRLTVRTHASSGTNSTEAVKRGAR